MSCVDRQVETARGEAMNGITRPYRRTARPTIDGSYAPWHGQSYNAGDALTRSSPIPPRWPLGTVRNDRSRLARAAGLFPLRKPAVRRRAREGHDGAGTEPGSPRSRGSTASVGKTGRGADHARRAPLDRARHPRSSRGARRAVVCDDSPKLARRSPSG